MSLQEDLKKNDLYAPYAKKLDQLLKGGPGSGPQGGKGNKDGKPSAQVNRGKPGPGGYPQTGKSWNKGDKVRVGFGAHEGRAGIVTSTMSNKNGTFHGVKALDGSKIGTYHESDLNTRRSDSDRK